MAMDMRKPESMAGMAPGMMIFRTMDDQDTPKD